MSSSSESKKTVIITGGSKGIGLATALVFAHNGYRVGMIAKGEEALEEARKMVLEEGVEKDDVGILSADLSDIANLTAALGNWSFVRGELTGLVLNAGAQVLDHAMELSPDDIMSMIHLNVLSPIVTMQFYYDLLKKSSGSIAYVGSVNERKYIPRYSAYGGTKAFMSSFVRHAAHDLGPDGVRINIVTPGAIDTPMLQDMLENEKVEHELEEFLETVPIEKRLGEPREVAETIYFAITGPRYLHGDELSVHGGIG